MPFEENSEGQIVIRELVREPGAELYEQVDHGGSSELPLNGVLFAEGRGQVLVDAAP